MLQDEKRVLGQELTQCMEQRDQYKAGSEEAGEKYRLLLQGEFIDVCSILTHQLIYAFSQILVRCPCRCQNGMILKRNVSVEGLFLFPAMRIL